MNEKLIISSHEILFGMEKKQSLIKSMRKDIKTLCDDVGIKNIYINFRGQNGHRIYYNDYLTGILKLCYRFEYNEDTVFNKYQFTEIIKKIARESILTPHKVFLVNKLSKY